jgi:hypothetical protein|tara:strand:- start:290 stop:475 length:186 start_codon:yes stop_codon:yes gene_type:complete
MWVECHCNCRQAETIGYSDETSNNLSMATMHPIKVSYREATPIDRGIPIASAMDDPRLKVV